MTDIPRSHPRYHSLMTREAIVEGMKRGIVAEAGLIAHGRGEAFDYLMGEKTLPEAVSAEREAVRLLKHAENPVLSVNGNTAVLCAQEVVTLAGLVGARIEVNLFHRTEERVKRIVHLLREAGAGNVLGEEPDARIPGLEHERGKCTEKGIGSADVVLVPLEDGDRALALKKMGKTVICIDLNPLSRTSRTSDVSIVDEVKRAMTNMIEIAKSGEEGQEKGQRENGRDVGQYLGENEGLEKKREEGQKVGFDNPTNLKNFVKRIAERLITIETGK